jgi:hypothetical protein
MNMFIERIKSEADHEVRNLVAFLRKTEGQGFPYRLLSVSQKIITRLPDKMHKFASRTCRVLLVKTPTVWMGRMQFQFARAKFKLRDSVIRLQRRPETYETAIRLLTPLNHFLAILLRHVKHRNSVLHISYMVHIPYDTTRLLRRFGMRADYLALENGSPVWDKSDYLFLPNPIPFRKALQEFLFFWKVVAKYEFIHCHFGRRLTQSGWEFPLLKRMNRKIVVHFRGCEIRNRELNMTLRPECNICQECDYKGGICKDPVRADWCQLARKYGDLFLVTTPDMKNFVPEGIYFPFFLPQVQYEDYALAENKRAAREIIKIVHVTGHPGIEGTKQIQMAIQHLQAKGYPIVFSPLHGISHEMALREMADADLTIGKLKMGYYANAQIESMFLGVPAVTYVRPEYMTEELRNSGFIFTTLQDLANTLEHYLQHPEELERKRKLARSSILRLHDDEKLGRQLTQMYDGLKKGS